MLLLWLGLCTAQLTLHSADFKLIELHAYEEQYTCHPASGDFIVAQLNFVVCNNGTERHIDLPNVEVQLDDLPSSTLQLPYLRDQFCYGRRPVLYRTMQESISPNCCVTIRNSPCFWLEVNDTNHSIKILLDSAVLEADLDPHLHKSHFTPAPMILLLVAVFTIVTTPYFVFCSRKSHLNTD